MFSHDDIWRGIDRLASNAGYSASGLAKQAGLDPTSFNKSKRTSPDGKPRWPSTESLSKVLSVTGTTMADFIRLIDNDSESLNDNYPPKENTIPLIGFAEAGQDGFFDDAGFPAGEGWDHLPFPPDKNDKNTPAPYALGVSGSSMEPLYRDGDILIISPGATIHRGDRIIVKTTSGEIMAKELLKQSSSSIELKSLNPDYEDREISLGNLQWLARIMWVSQ